MRNDNHTGRVHVNSLRVVVPGSDAASGHEFVTDLSARLAEQAGPLLHGIRNRSVHVGDVNLSITASSAAEASSKASAAIAHAVARALKPSKQA